MFVAHDNNQESLLDKNTTDHKKSKSKSFINYMCCVFQSEDDDESDDNDNENISKIITQKPEEKKEKSELVLLGNIQEGLCTLVRLT